MRLGLFGGSLLLTVVFSLGCSSKSAVVKSDPRQAVENWDRYSAPSLANVDSPSSFQPDSAPTFDIPVVRNAKVEHWIAYFQGRGRKWFQIYLERSGKFVPFMQNILREHDLPEDLVYLSMIESGFSTQAYSRARAVGPWQFMQATGRMYGLDVNFWVDERRDPEKSSIAAARHLKDLYDQFQSWKLAAAAYNAGAGKVSRAIKRYRTEDFWELARGQYLRPETRHYVPKLIAAALIAKEPEKYGFTSITYHEPLQYDKIIVDHPVNLIQLAQRTGTPLSDIMTLNPELNHPMTPPTARSYELRIPAGRSERFLEGVAYLQSGETPHYAGHRVRRGDTLQRVANIYATTPEAIKKMNGLRGQGLTVGQNIVVPVALTSKLSEVPRRAGYSNRPARRNRPAVKSNRQVNKTSARVHVVRRGETLSGIARRYRVTVVELKRANKLRQSTIYPGSRLQIPQS
jgi:membrane-bound lytic murein transglycosylase D